MAQTLLPSSRDVGFRAAQFVHGMPIHLFGVLAPQRAQRLPPAQPEPADAAVADAHHPNCGGRRSGRPRRLLSSIDASVDAYAAAEATAAAAAAAAAQPASIAPDFPLLPSAASRRRSASSRCSRRSAPALGADLAEARAELASGRGAPAAVAGGGLPVAALASGFAGLALGATIAGGVGGGAELAPPPAQVAAPVVQVAPPPPAPVAPPPPAKVAVVVVVVGRRPRRVLLRPARRRRARRRRRRRRRGGARRRVGRGDRV